MPLWIQHPALLTRSKAAQLHVHGRSNLNGSPCPLPSPAAAWTVDEKLHTFVAVPTDSPSAGPPADVWRLRQAAAEQQAEAVQQVG